MIKYLVRRAIDRAIRAARMLAAALVVEFGLAAPVAANASVQPAAVSVYTMSHGRIWFTLAVVVGLIAAVIGGLALVLTRRTG